MNSVRKMRSRPVGRPTSSIKAKENADRWPCYLEIFVTLVPRQADRVQHVPQVRGEEFGRQRQQFQQFAEARVIRLLEQGEISMFLKVAANALFDFFLKKEVDYVHFGDDEEFIGNGLFESQECSFGSVFEPIGAQPVPLVNKIDEPADQVNNEQGGSVTMLMICWYLL